MRQVIQLAMTSTPPADLVKVVEVSKVAPAPPLPPSTSLPFTYYDAIWLRFPPIQCLFFYQTSTTNPNTHTTSSSTTTNTISSCTTTTTTTAKILTELKSSLSITLSHYFPLAGKLIWPPESDSPSLCYLQGDGAVSIAVAQSSAEEFHRLATGNGFVAAADYSTLLVNELVGRTTEEVPVMALQVTFFGEEGFSVGYTAHHAAVDGKSMAMFMHSWATICREKCDLDTTLMSEHTPCYDRTMISDPTNMLQHYLSLPWIQRSGPDKRSLAMNYTPTPQPDLMRGTFLLTRKSIEYLKRWVQSVWNDKYDQEVVVHLTSFTVTVAYVWVLLVKSQFTTLVEEGENSKRDKFYLTINVDKRSQIGDPRGSNFFGNCVGGHLVEMSLEELLRVDSVATAARGIGEAIASPKHGGGVLEKIDNIEGVAKLFSLKPGMLTSIGGSPKFNLYDVDFGWGRPKKVEMVSGTLSLVDSRDSKGGIEAGMVLDKPILEKFASLFASGLQAQGINDLGKLSGRL